MAATSKMLLTEKQILAEEQLQHVGSHQPCCLCAATGHGCGGAINPVPSASIISGTAPVPAGSESGGVVANKANPSLGDIATGMMLATGFTHWGWGYGLGWNKPDKSMILGKGNSLLLLPLRNLLL